MNNERLKIHWIAGIILFTIVYTIPLLSKVSERQHAETMSRIERGDMEVRPINK